MAEVGTNPAPSVMASILQLADQLQRLSEVAETLTYRLVDLEERLLRSEQTLDQRLGDADAPAAAALHDDVDLRLLETEERLQRLEGLLQGGGAGDRRRGLVAVPGGPAMDQATFLDDGHFIEDGEQPFMDELTA